MKASPTTYEAQYVARTVGPALSKGLAEIVQKRPSDPIEYLANFLYKYVDNINTIEKDKQDLLRIERLKNQRIQEEQHAEQLKREREEIRQREEELRKEKETEERRKKELEELAKRKVEVANTAPPLPSLAEEEDQIVEFGETKLHQQAGVEGANLTILLKENNSLAARNSQFKTARDIALEANLTDNVRQIDEFIYELVAQENYKQLTDLVVLGFYEDLNQIIENKYGNADQMIILGMKNQSDQFFTVFPQIQSKIRDLKNNVEKNDLESFKTNLDKKFLAFYRDSQGKSALHHSIEKKHFEISLYLCEKYLVLSKLNDCFEKYPLDYLKAIDPSTLDEAQLELYEKINNILNQ